MTCFTPNPAFIKGINSKTGKNKIVVLKRTPVNLDIHSMRLPCGQCVGCRLDYSRQWAIRCMHEASLHKENCFITLTYNDKFKPRHGSLNYEHWTNFMKRLRRRYDDTKIRFYMGPEYGEKSHRPHYHALLFGFDFSDKELFSVRNNNRLYTSRSLDSLWNHPRSRESYGFASVGSVTFQSAAYVARYMMKKVKGEDVSMRYFARDDKGFLDLDLDTGEVFPLKKEVARMSRKPGIGKAWFDLFKDDVYAGGSDFVVMNGKKVRPPRFYDNLYQNICPEEFEAIREQRVIDAAVFAPNNTEERLAVRLAVKEAQLSRLVRNLE